MTVVVSILLGFLVFATWPGAFLITSVVASGEHTDVELSVEPANVEADMFYKGATIRVGATVPGDLELALTCVGKDERIDLATKGKAFGLLWMHVGEVSFEHVPSLYLLRSSGPIDELAPLFVLEKLGVGYEALRARAAPDGGSKEEDGFFDEMIKLKEREGLYEKTESSLELQAGAAGRVLATTEFHLPAKAAPGDYQIELYGFREGKGELLSTSQVKLTQSSTVAFISTLARQHGLLYGILAVVIAAVVGLLTGIVFSSGAKKPH